MKKNILTNEEGNTIVIVAFIMVVVIGFCALVIDVGNVSLQKQRLQNAIDATCISASQYLPDTTTARTKANQYIQTNGFKPSDITITFTDSNKTMNITSSKQVKYTFAKIFGISSTNIHPSTSAKIESIGAAFDYALFSGGLNKTLSLNGSSFYIGGDTHSNYKFSMNGSSMTITGRCEAVSTISINGSNINIGSRVSNVPVIDMPDFSAQIKSQAEAAGTAYIGNKTFNGSSLNVTSPIYVDGNVTINGSRFIGVGSILATGNITFNGSNLNFSSTDAVCFYSKNGNITVNGSSAVIDGIMYAPNGTVNMNGSSQTVNGRVVASDISFNGSNTRIISGNSELLCLPKGHVRLTK